MSEKAPSTNIDAIWQNEDLSTWEKIHEAKKQQDINDIVDDDERSDWEKIHALKDLGHEAVEQSVKPVSTTPESAIDDSFKPGTEVSVMRHAYTDNEIDHEKPGHLEGGWKVESIGPDGRIKVSSETATLHDGSATGVYRYVTREQLQNWKTDAAIIEQNKNDAHLASEALGKRESEPTPTPPEFVEDTPEYERLNDKIYDGAIDIISQISTDRFSATEAGRDFINDTQSGDNSPESTSERKTLHDRLSDYIQERKRKHMIKDRAKKIKKIREQKKREQKEAIANSHKPSEGKISAKDLLAREGVELVKKDRIGRALLRKVKNGVISFRNRSEVNPEDVTSDEVSEPSYDEFVSRNQQETLNVTPEQVEETPTTPINLNRGEETPESAIANNEADLRAAASAVNASANEQPVEVEEAA